MQRLIVAALVAAGSVAHAQPAPAPTPDAPIPEPGTRPDPGAPTPDPDATRAPPPPATVTPAPTTVATPEPDEGDGLGDQAISVELGLAGGGRVTPGGLRIAGQYLYQLSDEDWFDGAAIFTFGSGDAACFRDRQDRVVCRHGVADGAGVEISASVRRMFAPQGAFHPFARIGVGLGVVRFGDDDVSGFTIPAHAGGGVHVGVAPSVSIVSEAELEVGFGRFSRGLGSQLQFGLAVTAGVEFRLR